MKPEDDMPVCPQHPHVKLHPMKKGWYCEECDSTVLTYHQVPRPSVVSAPAEPESTSWPAFLAESIRHYHQESHPVLKLWQACDTFELMLRFLVIARIGELVGQGALEPALSEKLGKIIERPTFGQWRRMAADLLQKSDRPSNLMPEVFQFANEVLLPLLDGPTPKPSAETSLIALRNRLAHGGGVTRSVATSLLSSWEPRIANALARCTWLHELTMVIRTENGGFAAVPGSSASDFHSMITLGEASSLGAGSVFLIRNHRVVPLWPLMVYEPVRHSDPGRTALLEPTLQVYFRRGDSELEYTPLGADHAAESLGSASALATFLQLFRLDRPRQAEKFLIRGFEDECLQDAKKLVGRHQEVEKVLSLCTQTEEGVLWVFGQAGIGKSIVLARIAERCLLEQPETTLTLVYRFRQGDAVRCRREAFLQFSTERLAAWLADVEDAGPSDDEPPTLQDRLFRRLERIPPQRKVLFILDGLDELALQDADFAQDIPLKNKFPRVLWLCAGRPERGLPEAFQKAQATRPFENGLPAMDAGDIRTMMIEKMGPLRRKLVCQDQDQQDHVANPFIEQVVRHAQGLPIYVQYVIGDILSGKLRPETGATRLPPSLAAYHEELLQRCNMGDLHQLLTPMVAMLALAREPLTRDALAALLIRRTLLRDATDSREKLAQALVAVGSMVHTEPTPNGELGYTLWHESLREHLLTSPSSTETVVTAKLAMAEAAMRPGTDGASRYLYRQGLAHLCDVDRRDDAIRQMTELTYLKKRLAMFPGPEGQDALATGWLDVLAYGTESSPFSIAFETLIAAAKQDPEFLPSLLEFLLWYVTPSLETRLPESEEHTCVVGVLVDLATTLHESTPEFLDVQRNLAVCYDKVAKLHRFRDPELARSNLEKALAIRLFLLQSQPDNDTLLRDSSVSYDKLAKLDQDQKPELAKQRFKQALSFRKKLVSRHPENTQYLRDYSVSLRHLGDLEKQDDPTQAMELFLQALEIRRNLREREPLETQRQKDLDAIVRDLQDLSTRKEKISTVVFQRWKETAKVLQVPIELGLEELEKTRTTKSETVTCFKQVNIEPENISKNTHRACLVLIYGEGELGKRFDLSSDQTTIGRSSTCTICINNVSLSRTHCFLDLQPTGCWVVRDNHSTNSTWVNDAVVRSERVLKSGDRLKLGLVILKVIYGPKLETEYYDTLCRLNTMDGLTQACSKPFFLDEISQEVDRAIRHRKIFSLIVLDIDSFKFTNDRYGPLACDHLLSNLAATIVSTIRQKNVFARTGGDEFSIILPDVSQVDALILAEELLRSVKKKKYQYFEEVLQITISLGVVEWNETFTSAENLYQAALELLTEAKQAGGNCVVNCAPEPPS